MEVQTRGCVDYSLLSFLASFSILPQGGARQATPGLLVAFSVGAWLMGSDTGLFLLSGAEEAMVTYNVCFSDDLRWQENVCDQLFCGKDWVGLIL